MSKFLKEIKREIEIRLETYKRELKTLEEAEDRIAELKQMISEAEAELKEYPEDDKPEEASDSEG